jgi:hypothetical protein
MEQRGKNACLIELKPATHPLFFILNEMNESRVPCTLFIRYKIGKGEVNHVSWLFLVLLFPFLPFITLFSSPERSEVDNE